MRGSMIDGVFNTLKASTEFMAHYGLTPSSPPLDIGKVLIQGTESDSSITGPRVYIYVKPGSFSGNKLVYDGKFCLDFIDKTSEKARAAFGIVFKIFHDKPIRTPDFNSYLCELAYDDDYATGIPGMKGYQSIFDIDYLRTN